MNKEQMKKIQNKIALKEETMLIGILSSFAEEFPKNTEEWFKRTNSTEVVQIAKEIISQTFEEIIVDSLDSSEIRDGIIGEVVDKVKNLVILKYKYLLLSGKDIEIEDPEIKSEVIDYLFSNNYKIKITNNKIELL